MRSIWFLILFGSLIAYHCLPPVAGDAVEAAEHKPTYSECKPYVDAALKGDATTDTQEESKSVETVEESGTEEQEDTGTTKEETSESTTSSTSSTSSGEDDTGTGESTGEVTSDEVTTEETTTAEEQKQESSETNESEGTTEEETATTESQDNTQEEGDKSGEDSEQKPDEADGSKSGDTEESGEVSKSTDGGDSSNSDNVADDSNQSESQETKEGEEKSEKDKADSVATKEESQETSQSEEDESASNETSEDEDNYEPFVPEELDYEPRSREHMEKILGLDGLPSTENLFKLLEKTTQTTLKELKGIYENAIKPLEMLYKYRDLSNRHFGDPEIFSKPLVLFMGPWSGGKSSIINWLLGVEHQEYALRTGADPSPAHFNILMHGKEDEVLDGTQIAADWTFSGLQKFGQSYLDRLSGRRMPNRLLEKVNLVEIPGILEVRKQVERAFPFNDACQWFIDRADIIFLVYDPAKLDIGPETEAILDQLKGRENQVRIVLNKADTVKSDELLRVQATLIWNISPLMSSAEPPLMYAASLWDHPLSPDSPRGLLTAHENNFLLDIRTAVEKRVETRIAAARRFAVRVRNHAKMVDCYLNTYNNHRSFFSDKKKITKDIIEHPQNYHIYEGLSTLKNISRYDLPDPDTYREFFKLHSLWEFPVLSSTCSYFRGCPINKLDIAIAYELPDLLGKFRRQREAIISVSAQAEEELTGSRSKDKKKP